MISLEHGIFLEDSQVTLPWNIANKEAREICNAQFPFPNDDTRLRWNGHILNGLRCAIHAYLPDGAILEDISITLIPIENSHRSNDALMHYCVFFDHLVREIGTPMTTPADRGLLAPLLTWYYQGCILQLVTGERHGEYTTLEISKGKKPRYPTD